MNMVETSEVLEGPESFWQAVKYLHGEPSVGLVAVRHLLDEDCVADIVSSSRIPNLGSSADMPNIVNTNSKIEQGLMDAGILLSTLDVMNRDYWDPEAPFDMYPAKYMFTYFGRSILPHVDRLRSTRGTGVSISLSIGDSRFAAALPPVDLRKRSDNTEASFAKWEESATSITETLHYADLGSGDAAFWLQPGVHAADTSDLNRFGCLYVCEVSRE